MKCKNDYCKWCRIQKKLKRYYDLHIKYQNIGDNGLGSYETWRASFNKRDYYYKKWLDTIENDLMKLHKKIRKNEQRKNNK